MEADPMSTHTTRLGDDFSGPAPAALVVRDSAPERVALVLPGVDEGWRYTAAYWRGTLNNLFNTNRLHAGRAGRYSAAVSISDSLCRRWQRLFDVTAGNAAAVPFLYNQSVGTLLYTRLLADLGINFRHLLHLRHETVHVAGVKICAGAQRQQLHSHCKRVLRMGEDKALVELVTQVQAPDGNLLAVVEDSFLVRRLPAADLAALPGDRAVMRDLLGLRRRAAQLDMGATGTCTRWLPLATDMGRAYGRVSGDMNPVHTGGLAARLFGVQQPFLQGLGLRNLVVRHLADMHMPMDRLSFTFARPATLGTTLSLLVEGPHFELQAEDRRLVAYGEASD
jgi:acyl dehydratase